jgi:SAM-dependent methyltransferase
MNLIPRSCPLCGGAARRTLFEARDLNAGVAPGVFPVVRCLCGMAYLASIPARPDEGYPPSYDAHAESSIPAAPSRRFDRVAGLKPGRLVDVGCGSGRDLLALRKAGWAVRGVETSGAAVRRARAAGLDVVEGTLEEARLGPGSADLVTMFHVLEHVSDPVAVAREAGRILAPGGVLLAHLPNFGGLNARLFGEFWYELDAPRHVNFFKVDTARRMVAQAGLRLRHCGTRAAPGDFRRSLRLALGRYPLRPFDGALRIASRMVNLFRWGDVIELIAARPRA